MARKPKPLILTGGQLIEREQQAHLAVIDERKRLAIEEANAHAGIRAACLQRLVTSASVTIADVLEPSREMHGRYTLKRLDSLPTEVARAIKKVRIKDTIDGQIIEVELAHHLSYDELIGKYVGLWQDKSGGTHLHLHNHQADGTKLSELTPEQLAARRAQLEAEVRALDAEEGISP